MKNQVVSFHNKNEYISKRLVTNLTRIMQEFLTLISGLMEIPMFFHLSWLETSPRTRQKFEKKLSAQLLTSNRAKSGEKECIALWQFSNATTACLTLNFSHGLYRYRRVEWTRHFHIFLSEPRRRLAKVTSTSFVRFRKVSDVICRKSKMIFQNFLSDGHTLEYYSDKHSFNFHL